MSALRATVCFGGYHGVNVFAKGMNIRKQLIEPLQADVILALTYRRDDNCSSIESCDVPRRLEHLQPFQRVEMQPMQLTKDLAYTMEKLPHWNSIIRTFNSSHRTCFRDQSWNHATAPPGSTPWICIRLQNTQYNTIFSPVIGNSALNVLRQQYALSRCLHLSRAQEAATGHLYDRIVHSRLEYIWMAPHPPLELLDRRCAWVPDGEDFGGLNDRHAVLNREHAAIYHGRWEMILDGRVMTNNPNLRAGTCCGSMSDEKWLYGLMRHYRVPVCRFPELSFLTCCNSRTQKNCFRHTCYKMNALNMTLFAKSSSEFGSCVSNARMLRDPNMTFVRGGTLNLTILETWQKHRLHVALKRHAQRSPKRQHGEADWVPGYVPP